MVNVAQFIYILIIIYYFFFFSSSRIHSNTTIRLNRTMAWRQKREPVAWLSVRFEVRRACAPYPLSPRRRPARVDGRAGHLTGSFIVTHYEGLERINVISLWCRPLGTAGVACFRRRPGTTLSRARCGVRSGRRRRWAWRGGRARQGTHADDRRLRRQSHGRRLRDTLSRSAQGA